MKSYGATTKAAFRGSVSFDSMILTKLFLERCSTNENKPESYKLDYIAKQCFGSGKTGLSIQDMWAAWLRGDIGVVAEYCQVDAQLPLEILRHNGIPMMLSQVAALSGCTLDQAFRMTNSTVVVRP